MKIILYTILIMGVLYFLFLYESELANEYNLKEDFDGEETNL